VTVERDEWPTEFPLEADGRVAAGLPVWSLSVEVAGFSGHVEGRTTGGRRPCAAPSCGGWFIGVRWETDQQMFLCTPGWEYNPAESVVRMTKGSGLSTTIATDQPNVRASAPPRSEWPSRDMLGPAWRVRGDGGEAA
jgi:hypothetical protein